MIKIFSLLLILIPAVCFSAEKVVLYSDMVIRKCVIRTNGEKMCLGDFSHPKKIIIELKDGQNFATRSWRQNYKIGSEVFTGSIDIGKNLSNSMYLIQLQIKGRNFNPKVLVTLKDLKSSVAIDVKDDSLIIADSSGEEWSPSLYIELP